MADEFCGLGSGRLHPGCSMMFALKVGDEVVIPPGVGLPPQSTERIEIVIGADGVSALTDQGTLLCCLDGPSLTKTGINRVPVELTADMLTMLVEWGQSRAAS